MARLPYNPTRILPSRAGDDGTNAFYVFQPSTASSLDSRLSILNVTEAFEVERLPSTPVSDPLPFAGDGNGHPYTPAVEPHGDILVWAGKCQDGAGGSRLWRFTRSSEKENAMGEWSRRDIEVNEQVGNGTLQGANFLASGVSFSTTRETNSQMYVFGGMCPATNASVTTAWTQSADYSNTMVAIRPSQQLSEDTLVLETVAGRGPPIPEAGFTMTPLEPTYFLSPSDHQTQHQNQNYILLGGHTQHAFINMSQVALFSLPEESWSFLPVESPPAPPQVDLAARAAPTVEPRSGHTAVITPDGDRLVVFGGWVGDVNTPAHPQMAVLHLGDGYGGNGQWRWSIPAQEGLGLDEGTGLFGHGAVMLPGSVMLIMGGYMIPPGGTTRRKRNDPRPNQVNYLYNTTSGSWISSYTPPTVSSNPSDTSDAAPSGGSKAEKAGLAAGLTFGLSAAFILIVVYWWYRRRLKRRNARKLATEDHRVNIGRDETNEPRSEMSDVRWRTDDNGMSRGGDPWARPTHGPPGERMGFRESDADAERTGLLFEIPSPTRGLRRSLHTRGSYQPAPRYEEGRRAHGPGNIHPIDERDEYDEDRAHVDSFEKSEMAPSRRADIFQSAPVLEYHRDPGEPPRSSSPQSSLRARELEVRNWISDWAAANALMHHNAGRTSPDKTDRTSSTLSEQSMRSTASAQSYQPSVSRSISQRSGGFFGSKALAAAHDGATAVPPPDGQGDHPPPSRGSHEHRRTRSLTLFSSSPRMMASDVVAHPSFPQLQAESEALLGSYRDPSRVSPTRNQRGARGWMGTVRRAFTGADRSRSSSPQHGASSASSSGPYRHPEDGLPKRAASASAALLWQKRQGAKDWDADRVPSRDGGAGNGGGVSPVAAGDEEWDVESAVERRVVQVMFTVPREKLRVVNGGPDGDGASILSAEVKEQGDVVVESGGGLGKAEGKGEGKGKGKEREVDVG